MTILIDHLGCRDAMIIFFDCTSVASFQSAQNHLEELSKQDCIKVLVGTKADLADQRMVTSVTAMVRLESMKFKLETLLALMQWLSR